MSSLLTSTDNQGSTLWRAWDVPVLLTAARWRVVTVVCHLRAYVMTLSVFTLLSIFSIVTRIVFCPSNLLYQILHQTSICRSSYSLISLNFLILSSPNYMFSSDCLPFISHNSIPSDSYVFLPYPLFPVSVPALIAYLSSSIILFPLTIMSSSPPFPVPSISKMK